MTNFEKYKDDLIEIEGEFAVNKNTGEVTRCDSYIECKDCIFFSRNCAESDKIQWLYEEYKEPVLSDDELELIKVLGKINEKEYEYVVRDKYGIIRLFEIKPHIDKTGNPYSEYIYADIGIAGRNLFTNIAYEDGLYDIKNKCFIKV